MELTKRMKKVLLKDLVKKDVKGLLANVILQGTKFQYEYQKKAKIRQLKRVYYKIENDMKWIYWEWIPKPTTSMDTQDCGFSGIAISENHSIDEIYIYIED